MQDKPAPSDERLHLEDLEIGKSVPFGYKAVTRDEIIAYARAYDPQLIHLDEEAAKKSIVGGLCASGFHSCAMLMRMLADDVLNHATSQGSPGIDEVKWMKPVRPGDVLTARYVCTQKRALRSRRGVGIARMLFEMLNQKGEVVMSWDSNQLLSVRNPEAFNTAREQTPAGDPQASKSAREPLRSLWEGPDAPPPSSIANYFEDRVIGETADLGTHTFTPEEIIAFARAYDPQPFHVDAEAAKASLFGGLCASGWHTAAIYIRLTVALRQRLEAEIAESGGTLAIYGPSPGFKALRWLKPVYAGDTITFRNRTVGKVDLKSRPDRGLIVTHTQGRNQHGDIAFAVNGQILAERRTSYRPG